MKRHEFVAFVAAVMAVNALGVDLMLPSLPTIGHELAVVTANGTRAISQTGALTLIALSLVHTVVIAIGVETLPSFVLFQALSMTCIGLCGSNFGAMAMEPVGHIAGSASSIQGFIVSIGAVIVGSIIGQSYNGSTLPLALGYLAIGLAVIAIIGVVERGQLFQGRMAPG